MNPFPHSRLLMVLPTAALLVATVDLAARASEATSPAPGVVPRSALTGGAVTAYTYRLRPVAGVASFTQRFPRLPADRTYLVSYWLQADLSTPGEGLGCQIEDNTVQGTPVIREVALSASRQAELVTDSSTGLVSTSNRRVDLACFTDSGGATIASMPSGAVTFVPVGTSVRRTASLAP